MLNHVDVKLAVASGNYDGLLVLLCKECSEFLDWQTVPVSSRKTLELFLQRNADFWKPGKINCLTYVDGERLCRLVIGGCGEGRECNPTNFRKTAGEAVRALQNLECEEVLLVAPVVAKAKNAHYLQALATGLYLGAYHYDEYKAKEKAVQNMTINVLSGIVEGEQVLTKALVTAEAVCFARDLINKPGNAVYPEVMAEYAEKVAQEQNLEFTVLDEKVMAEKQMNAILAVGRGSVRPPRMIILKYQGNGDAPFTAYVGKGITFDSGGISIKPSEGMGEMKDDMSGAAIVLGTMQAMAKLKLPINLYGVLACAENMPDGNAQRPGDIVRAANGKTIEVLSTDAEGRMVLADAVWYACQLGAKKVIDIATLTGAVIIALGNETAGIVANDQDLAAEIMRAGKLAGENFWNMPVTEEYHEAIKGEVSDLKNSCGRAGGCITGGLFIGEFVDEGIAWAHLDIGGTATASKNAGFKPKGGTAFGLMTLLKLGEG